MKGPISYVMNSGSEAGKLAQPAIVMRWRPSLGLVGPALGETKE